MAYFQVRSLRRLTFLAGAMIGMALCFVVSLPARATEGINRTINYQGRLLDNLGSAVADGGYSIKFSLYDGSGTRLWTAKGTTGAPTATTVTVVNGLFTVQLGDVSDGQNTLDIDWNQPNIYLGVTVGTDSEMTPRKRLTAVPYAFNAEALQGQHASSSIAGGTGGAVFALGQHSTDVATRDRTVLYISTSGTTDQHDYLLKASNGSEVLTINHQGNVTSTGNLYIGGNTILGRTGSPTYITLNGQLISDILPSTDDIYSLGSGSYRWHQLSVISASTTNLTFTAASGTDLHAADISVSGTSTLFGPVLAGSASAATAPFYLNVSPGSTSNRLFLGQTGNLDVVIGGTTSTLAHPLFQFSGNDLFVEGNIGSATSVFSGGAFVASSTNYADGSIVKDDGAFSITASSGPITLSSGSTMLGPQTLTLDPGGLGVGSLLQLGRDATDTVTFSGTISSSVIPTITDSYALGDSTHWWSNVFATNASTTNLSFETATGTTVYASTIGVGTSTPAYPLDVVGNIQNTLVGGQSFTTLSTTATGGSSPTDLKVVWPYAYMLEPATNLLEIFDISKPSAPVSVGSVTVGNGSQHVYVSGKYAYITNTSWNLLQTIDISNPHAPKSISTFMVYGSPQGVYSAGGYTFSTSWTGNNFQVLDVSNPYNPRTVTAITLSAGPQEIAVQGRYAYVTEYSAHSIAVVDIKDPTAPVKVGEVAVGSTIDNTDTGRLPYGITVDGRYAYVASQNGAMVVVDVSDPTSPSIVVKSPVANSPLGIAKSGRYVFVTRSMTNAVTVFDVIDPTNPVNLGTITLGNNVRGVALSGRYLVVANSGGGTFSVVDLHGIETSSLEAHSAFAGTLQVGTDATVGNDLRVGGSLAAGRISANGNMAVFSPTGTALSIGLNSSSTSDTALSIYRNCGNATNGDLVQAYADSAGSTHDLKMRLDCSGNLTVDGTATGGGADFAEYWYTNDASITTGEVVALSTSTIGIVRGDTLHRYTTLGVISDKPGFLGNGGSDKTSDPNHWKVVGMLGQLPVKADATVDPIHTGDALMVADGGVVVRARGVGVIVGRAREDLLTGTGLIQVYVKPEWTSEGVLEAMPGGTRVQGNMLMAAAGTADAVTTTMSSFGVTFQGNAWDNNALLTSSFTITNDVLTATTSRLTISNTAGTNVLTVSDMGDLRIARDAYIGGKLYLGTRSGTASTSTYIFVDDNQEPGRTYIATNADGWQTSSTYDYAERFHSKDALQPGDVVATDATGVDLVRRANSPNDTVLGIVSTKPGFITGAYASGTYPIALAGRVPTRVSTVNGAIKAGDDLAPSAEPGVAVKAVGAGPTIGVALDSYDSPELGLISVFVQPGWKGGDVVAKEDGNIKFEPKPATVLTSPRAGLARIAAGSKEVHVSFTSLNSFPLITVTPYGNPSHGWWLRDVTDRGFTIIMNDAEFSDILFAWKAEPSAAGYIMSNSDGTSTPYDELMGTPIGGVATSTPPAEFVTSTDLLPAPSGASSTQASIDGSASSSGQTVLEDGAASSTE